VIAVNVPVDGKSHSVTFTHAGGSGTYLYADALLVAGPNPAPVFVMQSPAPAVGTWTAAQVTTYEANFPLVDAAIRAATASFPNAIFVATNVTAAGISRRDGIHPNDRGMSQRAADLVDAVTGYRANNDPDSLYATL
jgi:lysophospholipase L1-like esterase